MTIIPLWAKAIILAAIVAACAWGVHLYNQGIRDTQRKLDVAEYSAKLIAAQEDAKAQEMAWREQSKKSQEKTNEQLNARDRQYQSAVNTIGGLRNTITNLGNGLSTLTATACSARIEALSAVFGECAERRTEVAKAATGQLIDSMSCRDQWPK